MVGTAKSGRRRVALPKGEDAEKELARLRRNERRKERRARKAAEERGETYVPESAAPGELDTDAPPPVDFTGLPSAEELKAMFAEAFASLGGVAGLVAWGRRYPKEFYPMWAKLCLPKDGGTGDGPDTGLESMLRQLDGRNADKETVQ